MQVRNPCEPFCLHKALRAQVFAKRRALCVLRRAKCQARISFALLSIAAESVTWGTAELLPAKVGPRA